MKTGIAVESSPGSVEKRARRIGWRELGKEPFRAFFPAGVLAGIVGVLLWPLYFGNVTELYPGLTHARIMTFGLFGGFIFGFLGTAMPRMLSAPPLGAANVAALLGLHLAMVGAFAAGSAFWGDALFGLLLVLFISFMATRAQHRQDIPPPGFALVGLAMLCALAGTALALIQHAHPELETRWVILPRLLIYQGFVLFPILGVGPFILPRLFGRASHHDFPQTLRAPEMWKRKAALALAAGALILASFFLEAFGWHRTGYALRFAVTVGFLCLEFPLRRAPGANTTIGLLLRVALASIAAGFLAVALFPEYRAGLLHLTLVGGFAVITFVVATRVVFGHSGKLTQLQGRNRWLWVAVGMMLFGMVTRISGDVWPKIMVSHYVYGAVLWVAGALIWAWHALPRVFEADEE